MYKEAFDLTNKIAILIGGTGLIGAAFARGLAEFGARVVVCDIDQRRCEALAGELEKEYRVPCLGSQVNVVSRVEVEGLLDKTLQQFGAVHILINSAQNKTASFFERFESYPDGDLDGILDVNLKAVHLACQVIGGQMVKQGGGSIINLASTYAVVAPNQEIYENTRMGCPAAYSASKGGVIALTRYLATYWARHNVRVNSLCPHGVYNNHEETFVRNFSSRSPMGRMSTADEVVGAMLFLASDASSYVTGHNLMVDGGWTAW
jgi:NAD(P)-dependent dehydrogenase (short-subunit alcohol dehydrogenase family)